MAHDIYVISDAVWQDVLSLVPLAIWSEPPSQQPLCVAQIVRAGWGECDFAQSKSGQDINLPARGTVEFRVSRRVLSQGKLRGAKYRPRNVVTKAQPLKLSFSGLRQWPARHLWIETVDGAGHTLALPPLAKDGVPSALYAADDGSTYYDAGLTRLAQAGPARAVHQTPALVYHRESQAFDIQSLQHFLAQYRANVPEAVVTHIGPWPEPLKAAQFPAQEEETKEVARLLDLQRAQLKQVDTIVIVSRRDYRAGLIAAAYASLRHALLFFVDHSNIGDYRKIAAQVREKTVICVGEVDEEVRQLFGADRPPSCKAEELLDGYLAETLTSKIVLVNPEDDQDRFSVEEENKNLPRVGIALKSFFGRASLCAPFLAAAKHELILPVASTNPHAIDVAVEDFVQGMAEKCQVPAHYLTIFASPEAIPMAQAIGLRGGLDRGDVWLELDNRHYGSLGRNEEEVNLAVGRIFGITVSDCSAYVARVLFYDQLRQPAQSDRAALLILVEDKPIVEAADHQVLVLNTAKDLQKRLREKYFTEVVAAQFDRPMVYLGSDYAPEDPTVPPGQLTVDRRKEQLRQDFLQASLILYTGHADCNGFSPAIDVVHHYTAGTLLNFPIIMGIGCYTGAYEWLRRRQLVQQEIGAVAGILAAPGQPDPSAYLLTNLFVLQNLRRGAMGQQCAVDLAYFHEESDDLLRGLYVEGLSLGEAFRRAKNAEYIRLSMEQSRRVNSTAGKVRGDAQYVLIGDPTFVPHPMGRQRRL